jgi:hypothetical protein
MTFYRGLNAGRSVVALIWLMILTACILPQVITVISYDLDILIRIIGAVTIVFLGLRYWGINISSYDNLFFERKLIVFWVCIRGFHANWNLIETLPI